MQVSRLETFKKSLRQIANPHQIMNRKLPSTYYEPRPNAEQRAAGTNMPVARVEPFKKMRPSDEQGAASTICEPRPIDQERTLFQ
ncbi:hypothetical protein RRG08_006127 [Elysia crispata]|uniref:Uncharacterized protein n=1 Tax=Elysia crispata TaxID=231223 RepID=A0AAE0ZFQ5_9GAST|nr:hypothetical protein RRG08_006127 [Elysia crispata]